MARVSAIAFLSLLSIEAALANVDVALNERSSARSQKGVEPVGAEGGPLAGNTSGARKLSGVYQNVLGHVMANQEAEHMPIAGIHRSLQSDWCATDGNSAYCCGIGAPVSCAVAGAEYSGPENPCEVRITEVSDDVFECQGLSDPSGFLDSELCPCTDDTPAPGSTRAPLPTPAPAETFPPSTMSPGATPAPGSTMAPDATMSPGATPSPGATMSPGATPSPTAGSRGLITASPTVLEVITSVAPTLVDGTSTPTTMESTAAPTTLARLITTSPTVSPTMTATMAPTMSPTAAPTMSTGSPTMAPTAVPTQAPTAGNRGFLFTDAPTFAPTFAPTMSPTAVPTFGPTAGDRAIETGAPTTSEEARETEGVSALTLGPWSVIVSVSLAVALGRMMR